jgi:uncharacterized phiE125 gp8 family phage protein
MSDLLYTPSNGSFTGYSVQVAETAPVVEPITLAEAKEYARIDGSAEDALITALIKMARIHSESFTGKSLVPKTITITSFSFPYQFQMPYGPLNAENNVTKVVTLDQNGTETNLNYQVNPGLYPKMMILGGNQSYKFKTVYTAGFTTVPEDIKLAIKMLVNTLYERREDVIIGTIVADFPLGVKALLMPYKTFNWFGA